MSIVAGKLANHYCIDRIDPHAKLDWAALDRFPKLYDLDYEGNDTTLIGYLAKRKSITQLMWQAPGLTGTFDFRRTHLKLISIQPTKSLTVLLPRSTTALSLMQFEGTEKIRVESRGDGHGLGLGLQMASKRPPKLPRGVPRLSGLDVSFAHEVRIKNFMSCADLQRLSLHSDTRLSLPDIELLSKFKKLRELSIHGTTKATAAALRERFAHLDLEISGIRRS